jgi:hypothetical protein
VLILGSISTAVKGVYDPKAFIPHAALRRQTFVHCARFPVAATRRCMGRVSVPFCPFPLSGRVPVIGLVGHYPTNSLMGDRLIHRCAVKRFSLAGSSGISSSFDEVFRAIGEIPIHYSAVRNSLLTELVLLACIRHAASVNPGPGSNPQIVSPIAL